MERGSPHEKRCPRRQAGSNCVRYLDVVMGICHSWRGHNGIAGGPGGVRTPAPMVANSLWIVAAMSSSPQMASVHAGLALLNKLWLGSCILLPTGAFPGSYVTKHVTNTIGIHLSRYYPSMACPFRVLLRGGKAHGGPFWSSLWRQSGLHSHARTEWVSLGPLPRFLGQFCATARQARPYRLLRLLS
jgi:hypothetical protein